jgi:UDP-glucose 4-epimerase
LRGNDDFSYSRHKRLVEEMLADLRETAPQLTQTVFRIGTILGPGVNNQVTALWDARRLLTIAGSESPFVFVCVDDVVRAMVRAATGGPAGIFNLAGDGKLTVKEIARALGKKQLVVPAWALAAALWVGHALRLTPHGPAQVKFLHYRPVLDNTALKESFGFTPLRTSREAFEGYLESRPQQ